MPSVFFLTESAQGEGLCFALFPVEVALKTSPWPAILNKDALLAQ